MYLYFPVILFLLPGLKLQEISNLNRRQKEIRIVRFVDVQEGVTCAMI